MSVNCRESGPRRLQRFGDQGIVRGGLSYVVTHPSVVDTESHAVVHSSGDFSSVAFRSFCTERSIRGSSGERLGVVFVQPIHIQTALLSRSYFRSIH